jgi:hypothetical protein
MELISHIVYAEPQISAAHPKNKDFDDFENCGNYSIVTFEGIWGSESVMS